MYYTCYDVNRRDASVPRFRMPTSLGTYHSGDYILLPIITY